MSMSGPSDAMDEHRARVRHLNTERARNVPDTPARKDPDAEVGRLLRELIGALDSLYRTPPDDEGAA